ncbi:protein Spindly-like isoform X5 [Alligator sinensis]|nr:protein Spindly-like isoform X5 [Alligator sinensis]
MATEELAAIRRQLHSQAKIVESLTQSVNRLKQERELQQQRINKLEGEVHRLQNSPHSGLESLLGHRIEGLKSEFHNLQQQMFHQPDGDCTPDVYPSSSILQEMHESKKLLWQEYECVRTEVEQLKHTLNRQEEDLFHQMSATDEMKGTQSRYCKMLEDLMNSYRAQSHDLDKAKVETRSTQQELGHVKSTVTDLKDQMKSLCLEKPLMKLTGKKRARQKSMKDSLREEMFTSSVIDDSSSELSLTDVSSDELSSTTEIKEPEDPFWVTTRGLRNAALVWTQQFEEIMQLHQQKTPFCWPHSLCPPGGCLPAHLLHQDLYKVPEIPPPRAWS